MPDRLNLIREHRQAVAKGSRAGGVSDIDLLQGGDGTMITVGNQRTRVVAAVIEKNGSVLIARRRKGDKLAGKWEFPGGKIEQMETPEIALARELLEELGIEIVIGDLVCISAYDYDHLSVELMAYKSYWVAGTIIPLVHDEVRWVAPEELFSYDFPEANIPIIHAILGRETPGRADAPGSV